MSKPARPSAAVSIELTIERVELTGFGPVDGDRVAEALRERLAGLLSEGGWPGRSCDVACDRPVAASMPGPAGASAAALGRGIAEAIGGCVRDVLAGEVGRLAPEGGGA